MLITFEVLFEPMVMFFGLMNLFTVFKMMINEILQDLINTGEVVSFIIVKTKKEGHNKVVEEVVKRLVENDLYMKPMKCKWKVKKVRFLGVVIKLEGIKMEEEKVKIVLDWLISKEVKNIQKFLELANYFG